MPIARASALDAVQHEDGFSFPTTPGSPGVVGSFFPAIRPGGHTRFHSEHGS